jgi:membrane protease YdiL (CAAX protease family)
MKTVVLEANAPVAAPPLKLALVFAALFIAYQLPEGLGKRALHSIPVMSVLMLMFFPVAWLAGRALGYRGFDAWFMALTRGWALLLVACFALTVLAKAAALGAGGALGVYQLVPTGQAFGPAMLLAALGVLANTFFPSVAEDIVTRGFLMRAMPTLSTRWVFVPLSAGLFVLNHIYRLSNGPGECLALFCFGLGYAAALYYSRSLWAAIGLHWGWNFTGDFSEHLVSADVLVPALHPMMSAAANCLVLAIVIGIGMRGRRL